MPELRYSPALRSVHSGPEIISVELQSERIYLRRREAKALKGHEMKTHNINDVIDVLDVEARARRLRAEALAHKFGRLRRWISSPFAQ